jgi:hypothetical protein
VGSLKLNLREPSIIYRKGDAGFSHPGWQLHWKTSFDWLESVTLSNGADLAKLEGGLFLRVGAIDPSEAAKEPVREGAMFFEKPGSPIGLLHYLEATESSSDGVVKAEPDAYSVELLLSEEELRPLIEMVQAGHGPVVASVNVPGLRYGWAPDGSMQNWNLDEKPKWLIVDGLSLWFDQRGEEEPEEADELRPAPPSAELQALQTLTQRVSSFGPWVIGGLWAIFLAVIFR